MFLALALAAFLYILIALIPYMGRVYVSEETRNAFSMENFFGQYESSERVLLLETPSDAFFHRVNLISKAQEDILLSSFAIHEGIAGDIIVGALLSAADRGVDIAVIHNVVGGIFPSRYRNVLTAHENIEIYRFNRWEFFRPQYLNTALHDKYMVVDGQYMILGGRNISDRYFDPEGFSGNLSYDREVLVFNTDREFAGSIADVTKYFNLKIESDRSCLRDRRRSNMEAQKNNYIALYLTYKEGLASGSFDYYANTVGVNRITLITNPIDSTKNDSIVAYNLMMMTRNSDVIIAQSPYVVFTRRNFATFVETIQDRDVTLVTNSLASAVNIPAFSGYYVSRRRLVNAGITIYEFQGVNVSLHGKTYLFDHRLTAIGSFNMNERSIRSDTESMLIIDSEEFHDIVLDAINNQVAQSLRVANDASYMFCDHVEAAKYSFGKRMLYTIAGRMLRPFWFMF